MNRMTQMVKLMGHFEVKEPEFEVEKPESEVHVSPSSSAKIKKHDDKLRERLKARIMSTLEDITYSDDDEDVGVEVDFTNMETTITISPIPTTRVHKDHLVTQIIGDLSLATQTRSMTRMVKDQSGLTQINNEDFHTCMFVCFLSQEEPKRVHQALKDLSWIEAMQEELLQFKMQKVWVLVDLPNGKRAIVARIESIRLFLAYASFMGFMVYQMDVKSAFLYGTIKEEVYVDDIIFGSTNKDLCKAFEKLMKDKFQMSSMGKLTFFLGLQVKQKPDGIFISQNKYVAKILRKFGLTDGKSASTPVATKKPLPKDPDREDVDVHTYRLMIDSLMYLTSSRPDIMFVVCACARFLATSKVSYLHAVKRIFRYLKGKPHLGLWCPTDSPFNLVAYFDSDYAGASLDRKFTTGVCQFLGCKLISWQCKKQIVVVTSSTKADPDQTVSSKDSSNPLMADNLPKIVWYSTHHVALMKSWLVQKQTTLESIDCLPNEEIFTELARMGYEKPSTKLTFYKAFFSAQWKFIIHTILQCMSAKRTAWNEFSSSMASTVICLATGRNFNFSKAQVGDVFTHTTKYSSPALTQTVFANIRKVEKGFSRVETPLFEGMLVPQQAADLVADDVAIDDEPTPLSLPPTNTPPPLQELPSTSQVTPTPPPSPIAQPSSPPQQHQPSQPTTIFIDLLHTLLETCTTLTRGVKNLEQDKIAQALEITKLKQRVRKLEKKRKLRVSGLKSLRNVGGIIELMDADKDVTLKEVDAAKDAEPEPAELKKVLEVVTTAKLMTEGVTASATTVASTITAAPSAARRRKWVVIRDPEETATPSTIIHSEPKSKDKEKGIMYSNVAFLEKSKEQLEEEESRAFKRQSESSEEKAAKKHKLDEEVEELKKHLQIVPNDDDDVYTEATPCSQAIPKLSQLIKEFCREDLEMLWQLVQERFASSKPKNFSDDFLLTTLKAMFKKPNVEAQVWKNQRGVHDDLADREKISIDKVHFRADAEQCKQLVVVLDTILPKVCVGRGPASVLWSWLFSSLNRITHEGRGLARSGLFMIAHGEYFRKTQLYSGPTNGANLLVQKMLQAEKSGSGVVIGAGQ
nr:uncharacterized mitochondrial protein AtMg00810-like [Tanacetum cinerariifolium]